MAEREKQRTTTASAQQHSDKTKQEIWIYKVKEAIKSRLKDLSSAEFRNVYFTDKSGTPMVCGEINSKNGFGGMTGYQHFVGSGDQLIFLEEEVSDFHEVWNEMCVD